MQPMDPKRVKDLLVQAKKLGMTDRSFQLIRHLSRRGTHLETVSGMMAYCDKHEAFEIDNQRVGHRLDYVLRGYREFQEYQLSLSARRMKCSTPWRKQLGWAFRRFTLRGADHAADLGHAFR